MTTGQSIGSMLGIGMKLRISGLGAGGLQGHFAAEISVPGLHLGDRLASLRDMNSGNVTLLASCQ